MGISPTQFLWKNQEKNWKIESGVQELDAAAQVARLLYANTS